jgi:hypothetical protein
MKRTTPTAAAQAAKMIRNELKAAGIAATVRSSNFSMGNSVTVTLTGDPMPATVDAVTRELSKFQYGSFDAMQDLYEYTNHRTDIPQTKYLSIEVHYSAEIHQEAWDFIRERWTGWEACPANYADLTYRHESDAGMNAQQIVRSILCGDWDARMVGAGFWISRKPRVRLAA